MPIRSILVPIRGTDQDIHAIRSALRVARLEEAHVDVAFARATTDDLVAAWVGYGLAAPVPTYIGDMQDGVQQHERIAGKLVEKAASEFGIPVVSQRDAAARRPSISLLVMPGILSQVVATVGAFYDLIVYEREPEGVDIEPFDDLVLEAGLLGARRPCFLAPKLVRETFPSQVVVGWSGSVEGAQAVSAALPFLRQADNIHIVRVCDAGAPPAGEYSLIDYLRWHDLPAELHHVPSGLNPVATALLNKATELQADLLVMGGFTHGPVRQNFFGGVTRDILRHAPMPVLMAH